MKSPRIRKPESLCRSADGSSAPSAPAARKALSSLRVILPADPASACRSADGSSAGMLTALLVAFCALFAASRPTPPPVPQTDGLPDSRTSPVSLATSIASTDAIDPYGSVNLDIPSGRFAEAGFAWGDAVRVAIGDKAFSMPLLPHFRLVAPGEPALVVWPETNRAARIAVFYGSFAGQSGLFVRRNAPDGRPAWSPAAPLPLPVRIDLDRSGAFRENLHLLDLRRTNAREDYPDLSDDDFANFRAVQAPRLRPGALYRASSPILPELGRDRYVDDACRREGIRSVVDMADSVSAAHATPGFADHYVSALPGFYRQMGVDFTSPDFARDFADSLRFLATCELPCLLHCKEGQDRTGFACAVLECLFGATPDEAAEDYLCTFRNYYGTAPGTPAESALRATFFRILERAFGLPAPLPRDLSAPARAYLLSIGLSESEIASLVSALQAPRP